MADWQAGLWAALPALMALPLFLAVHLLAWQVVSPSWKGVAGLLACAAAAYALAIAVWLTLEQTVDLELLAVSLPLFAALVVLYMHLYFGMDRSLSMRMLGELTAEPAQALTLEQLVQVYSPRDMVARRVAVLLEKGLLEDTDGQFRCSARGRFLVHLARAGQRLYNMRSTG